jgi:hypothetical protein
MRRHRAGDQHMWYAPVTHCSWFNLYGKNGGMGGDMYRSTSTSQKQGKYTEPVLPVTRQHARQKSRQERERREAEEAAREQDRQAAAAAAQPAMRERDRDRTPPSRQNTGPSRQNTGGSRYQRERDLQREGSGSRGPSRQNTGGSNMQRPRAGMERVYPSMGANGGGRPPRRQDSGRSAQSSVMPPSSYDFNAGDMINPAMSRSSPRR